MSRASPRVTEASSYQATFTKSVYDADDYTHESELNRERDFCLTASTGGSNLKTIIPAIPISTKQPATDGLSYSLQDNASKTPCYRLRSTPAAFGPTHLGASMHSILTVVM